MSLSEYNKLNQKIKAIYIGTCKPCMNTPSFRKGDCDHCDVMKEYTALQDKKRALMRDSHG